MYLRQSARRSPSCTLRRRRSAWPRLRVACCCRVTCWYRSVSSPRLDRRHLVRGDSSQMCFLSCASSGFTVLFTPGTCVSRRAPPTPGGGGAPGLTSDVSDAYLIITPCYWMPLQPLVPAGGCRDRTRCLRLPGITSSCLLAGPAAGRPSQGRSPLRADHLLVSLLLLINVALRPAVCIVSRSSRTSWR